MSELDFQEDNSESLDIKGLVMRYLRYWYLFVIGAALALTAAHLYLRYSTPVYSVKATILIKDESGADLANSGVFGDMALLKSNKSFSNEVLVIKSKGLMERVLTELGMEVSYFGEGRIKSPELYGGRSPIKAVIAQLDSAGLGKNFIVEVEDNNSFSIYEGENKVSTHKFGEQIKKHYGTFTIVADSDITNDRGRRVLVRFNNLGKLANSYSKQLGVKSVNEYATVMELSLTDPVPAKGKDILNKLIEVYNRETINEKNLAVSKTIQFIDDRLVYLTRELTDVEKDVERYLQDNRLIDPAASGGMYQSTAHTYNQQITENEIKLEILKSVESYLQQEENKYELVPTSLDIADPTLGGLIVNFNELQNQRRRLGRSVTENNPVLRNVNEQLEILRLNILENIRNIREGLLVVRRNLQASARQFESQVRQVPSMQRELTDISRQQGIKEGLYLYLLQKREEAALSQAITPSNSRVLDPAAAGGSPIEPQATNIYLMSLLAGLAIPFAGIFLRDMLNDTIQEVREVEKATSTPILGEIGHNDSGQMMVVRQESRSSSAELFRLLRANMQFAAGGKENRVILVTSSMSGEGKTFFSLNLAASLGMTGKKVVVLGFDLRKPKLTQGVNLPNNIGITNYLISDSVQIEDMIQFAPDMPDLAIIGSGPIPPNPSELMLLPKIGMLIEELKSAFDYIILDSSPVGQVADTLALAPYIDSSLYIVRYNYTHKKQLQIIDDLYKSRKLKHPMIVLNDAKKSNSYGYSYGYGYGYGNYYEEESRGLGSKLRKLVKG
ncbi:polysaccharide biosynthesis tyrosine autokinase [Pontibacter sp. HSC-36F09]|uniref:GumC family protein n=1 Tax=Pontibacter sp. HSC-36F09 TaxID=2910966 RepID=UPI00209F0438|nr:polysaccharide biosynthesis tyrosine autokinase [Pontibacter sp. HSC-36F09]MCP2043662.1 capsular exopolysaccharide synthesis family protein [Pontibacter sp. HSC-36F09]